MKSLMTFAGILAFNLSNITIASDFSCPVSANVSNFTCSGTVKVKTLAELNAYRNDLGVVVKKPTIAKNLQIDFNPTLISDLVISTPCLIRIPSNVVMTSTANICLNGTKGIVIDDNFKFTGKNLKLESKEEVIVNKNAVIKAQDIKLLSIGVGDASKTYIRDGANVEAANLSIESFDKGFIGKNSIVKLTGALGIYSLGDDEASVREGSRVEAAKIEISSTEETRVAKLTTLIASEIILNGVKCTINKTAVITADDRLGNCFLTSTTNKAKFSINKNQGTNPLTVNFNASSIADAKGFIWSFGDGETLSSLTPTVAHVYNRVGSFTATLKYATKDNYKGVKNAGVIQIDVKETPISNPVVSVPPRGDLKYQSDGTFIYLRGFIRKGTYDIANAYYVIDDNQNNKIQIPNFYQNSLIGVEMHTFQRHKVTMHVVDVQGLTHTKSMNVYPNEYDSDAYPYIRLDVDQSAARTIFFDMSWSFNTMAGETLKNFTIDFGDGQTAVLTDTAFVTHTYAQAGTYLVRGTGQVNGVEDYDEFEVEVTDENTPIMNPVAGFEYHIYDYAGNVMFTNDRSGTPNGEIISYVWDFGDGTVGFGKNAANFYAPGDYLVTLTVTDTAGLRSSQTQKITIVAEGDEIASMLDCWSDGGKHLGCEVVAFDKFNQITRVKLDWGDGASENLTVPDLVSTGFSIREHNYQSYGTYAVSLTIDTSRGATKIKTFNNIITNPGSVDPTDPTDPTNPNPGTLIAKMFCNNLYLQVHCFANESTSSNSEIVNYRFEFSSDAKIDSSTNSQGYSYLAAGTYRITLIVRDANGLTASTFRDISVSPSTPEAHLGCIASYLLVSCNGINTFDYSGKALKYEFEMGDGTTLFSDSGFISHTYTNSGLYNVKLKVTNEFNKTGSTEQQIQVLLAPENKYPIIGINCSSPLPYSLVCSLGGSSDPDGWIQSYSVEFANNEVVSGQLDFSRTFVSGGSKEVKVKLVDDKGAVTTGTFFFNVSENIIPKIVLSCENNLTYEISCEAQVDAGESHDYITEFAWDMGDGESYIIYNSYSKIKHKYLRAGTYEVRVTAKDTYNGVASLTNSVAIKENIAPEAHINCIKITDKEYNCNAEGSKDLDGVISRYEWIIDGKIINEERFIHFFQDGGNKQVKLKITDNYGKSDTAELIIDVDLPPVDFSCIAQSDYVFRCEGVAYKSGKAIVDFKYLVDDAFEYDDRVITHEFSTPGQHQIAFFVRDTSGVTTLQYKNIAIVPSYLSPEAHFEEVIDYEKLFYFDAGDSLLKGRRVVLYKWNFAGTIVETTSSKTSHRFESYGDKLISLSVVDEKGSIHTYSKHINVYNPEVPYPVDNDLTMGGVDSDNNGIRDDVQRWIVFASLDNPMLKDQLSKLSRNWQEAIILDINNEDQLNLAKERENVNYCLQSFLNNSENVKAVIGDHADMMFNTRARLKKISEIQAKVNGTLLRGINTGSNLSQFCN